MLLALTFAAGAATAHLARLAWPGPLEDLRSLEASAPPAQSPRRTTSVLAPAAVLRSTAVPPPVGVPPAPEPPGDVPAALAALRQEMSARFGARRSFPTSVPEVLADEGFNPSSLSLDAAGRLGLKTLLREYNRQLGEHREARSELQWALAERKIAAGDYLLLPDGVKDERDDVPGVVYIGRGRPEGRVLVEIHPGEFPELEALKLEGQEIARAGIAATVAFLEREGRQWETNVRRQSRSSTQGMICIPMGGLSVEGSD